jgi:hypothetical protein
MRSRRALLRKEGLVDEFHTPQLGFESVSTKLRAAIAQLPDPALWTSPSTESTDVGTVKPVVERNHWKIESTFASG